MLDSNEAKNEYAGEASISDIVERDLRFQTSGRDEVRSEVTLRCSKVSAKTLQCRLLSTMKDELGESMIGIEGKVNFSELSTEISVSEVSTLLAG